MKCVKELNSGKITRVKDQKAATQVKVGTHQYVPKLDWKTTIRKVEVEAAPQVVSVSKTKKIKKKK